MIYKVLLLAGLLAMGEGAVLVRFINTVPTRTNRQSVTLGVPAIATAFSTNDNTAATYSRLTGGANNNGIRPQGNCDRVGLFYYQDTTSAVSPPTVVWTQLVEGNDVGNTAAPYNWYHAMPPLRGYHTIRTAVPAAEAAAVDKPLHTLAAADNFGINPALWDVYEQTRLKADGVGLYLSFAPGSYRFQAYTVMSDLTTLNNGAAFADQPAAEGGVNVFNNPARTFSTSTSTFTFEDNKVYTIIAYGDAAYTAQVPLTGANVRLTSIEESIAPTTFGKASLRFFHAITTESSNPIDVYQGANIVAANRLAANVAFGTVSSYVDVNPGLTVEFPVAVPGATIRPIASGIPVQRDTRAGMRATVICAVGDVNVATVFCRAIPSRAVAYVRLIHDAAGQNSIVQGRFGPQRLSETSLTLWASYEVPRSEQVYEQSQVLGNSVWTNHPATTEGLYPVVRNVLPNTVSGYGEVFVPLFIMDYAVRFVIGACYFDRIIGLAGAVGVVGGTTSGGSSAQFLLTAATNPQTWYWFAPIHKRVHFVVKTDGYATLTGRNAQPAAVAAAVDPAPAVSTFPSSARNAFPFVGAAQLGRNVNGVLGFSGIDTGTNQPNYAITLDEYIEPGQYYSIFGSASNVETTAAASSNILPNNAPLSYQDAAIIRYRIRLDRSATKVAEGIAANRGILTLVPFVADLDSANAFAAITQAFTAAPFTFVLNQGNTQTTPALATVGANRAINIQPAELTNVQLTQSNLVGAASADDVDIVLTPGTYTWTSTPGASTCLNNIPSGGSVTITDGTITDIFVLNSYGCRVSSAVNNPSLLKVVVQARSSAAATGHSPWTAATKRSAETAVPLYNAASSSAAASLLLALFAAVLAVFSL